MNDLVLTGVRVFDGVRYLGDAGDVLVRDGRIAEVGESLSAPDDVTMRFDGFTSLCTTPQACA